MGNPSEFVKVWFGNHTFTRSYNHRGYTVQIKTDNASAYVSSKMKEFFAYYNIKHITGILDSLTEQAVIERSSRTLRYALETERSNKVPPKIDCIMLY